MSLNKAPNGTATPAQAAQRLGRYAVVATLGQGGMGTIHLAVAGGLGEFRKLLVIKELRRDLAANAKFVEMFMAEAKLAARLNHPNIVQTLEAGQDGDRYFLAMEFLDGQPLTEVLKRAPSEPCITLNMRLQMLCDVLAGLHYAHELCEFDESPLQIVHRDVSPHNVFVTYHGQVKVVDFGIAKAVDIDGCTSAGVFKGKFSYAAPEQVNGCTVDRRADVFAVGVMLWEVLSERRFAAGGVTEAAVDARLKGAEPRLAQVAPGVPAALAAICDRAIHVDPEQRYPSAEAFRADLAGYLAERGELTQPAELAEILRTKFATERSAMHRMIHAQAKHQLPLEDVPDSIVRSLSSKTPTRRITPIPSRPPANSEQGERAMAEDSTPLERKRRSIRRSPWLLAPALAAFALTYAWVRHQTEPGPHAPLKAAAPPLTAASTPAPAEPEHPPQPAQELATPAEKTAEPAAETPAPARRVRKANGAATGMIASVAHPAPGTAGSVAPRNDAERVRDAGLGSQHRPVQAGDDLRLRRRPQAPRTIELENPFR
jgi:eukaryotic-like serine/threonine-protein kinase